LNELNNHEFSCKDKTNDIWGGSNIIGGSPRVNGSRLSPKEVETIINEFLKKKTKM
jgi:hypothetical protein